MQIQDVLFARNIIVEKKQGWFISIMYSALLNIDFEKNSCRFLMQLPSNELFVYGGYECCNKVGEYIYIFPRYLCGDILVIDLDGNLVAKIVIKNIDKVNVDIVATCIYRSKIYAFSLGLKKIIVLDLKNNLLFDLVSVFADINVQDNSGSMLLFENSLYCAIPDSNRIYKYDLIKERLEEFQVGVIENGIESIGNAGKKFWITSKEKKLYLWEPRSGDIVSIKQFPKGLGFYRFNKKHQLLLDEVTVLDKGFTFGGVFLCGNIWLIPHHYNKIMCLNVDRLEIKEIPILNEDEDADTWGKRGINAKYCMEYVREDRYIGVYSFKNQYIFEIDTQTFNVEIKKISILDADISCLKSVKMKWEIERNGFIRETETMNLDFFIKSYSHNGIVQRNDNMGASIYKYIDERRRKFAEGKMESKL